METHPSSYQRSIRIPTPKVDEQPKSNDHIDLLISELTGDEAKFTWTELTQASLRIQISCLIEKNLVPKETEVAASN